jgi:hypothetical protein
LTSGSIPHVIFPSQVNRQRKRFLGLPMEPLNAHTRYARVVIPEFLYIYCFPIAPTACSRRSPARTTRTATGVKRRASPRPRRLGLTAAGRYRPQRRHRRYAALRHVIDGNSSGDRLQPRDDRQGSREGSVSSPVLFFERRAAFGPPFVCAGVGSIALHRPTLGTYGAARNGRLRS